jgi:tetratricopeptide (TPR) repeat protein
MIGAMRRPVRPWFMLPLLLALACGGRMAGAPVEPMSLSQVSVSDDPVRRASLRLCVSGLDADAEGRRTAALGQYERAIQIDPTNPYAYFALARHEVDGGDPERSLEYLDQAEMLIAAEGALSPGAEANLAGLRGAARIALGEDGGAELREAQRLAPDVWNDGRLDPEELR